MTDTTYNGWKNYETWLIGLWLDNDQGTYSDVRAMVHDLVADDDTNHRTAVATALQGYVEGFPEVEAIQSRASFVADLFGAAFSEIDWYELAEHYMSEISDEAT